MPDIVTRKLTPTQVTAVSSGTNAKGGEWTLYKVVAVDEAGQPIDAKLKSFTALKVGELAEVVVERQEDPKYGVSFLLKPSKGGLKASVDELRGQVDELRGRIERLESHAGVGDVAGVSDIAY